MFPRRTLAPITLEFYLATSDNPFYVGQESVETIARHIVSSSGPSGTNREYLYQLAHALREILGEEEAALYHDSSDRHLFELEKRVRSLEDTLQ